MTALVIFAFLWKTI